MFEHGIKRQVSDKFPVLHSFRAKNVERKILDGQEFSDFWISQLIDSGQPALVGRLGGTEARVLGCYLDIFKGKSLLDPFATANSLLTFNRRNKQLKNGAGFYPISKQNIIKFAQIYMQCMEETDVLGAWGTAFTWPEYLLAKRENVKFVPLVTTAPWVNPYMKEGLEYPPWSTSLNGKRILIVSSFSRSFQSQFSRIDKIFPKSVCHDFNPEFLEAPTTQGEDSSDITWFNHLEATMYKMQKIDFDVALISAGSYSYPLAAFAKNLGKIGVHSGGELQLFFGVLGERWKNYFKYLEYKNEYWVRPLESERPANWKTIEGGCYW